MTRVTALTALVALGLSGTPFHEPFHGGGAVRSHPVTVRSAGRLNRDQGDVGKDETFYGIMPKVARMLGWLVRHEPGTAGHVIGSITGEA
jgi:hypothetical protein